MKRTQGYTLTDLLVVIGVVLIVAGGLLLPIQAASQERSRALECRNNLKQLAVAMAMYVDTYGGHKFYPYLKDQENGAEFLAMAYWSTIVSEPSVFICPDSQDYNTKGRDLGTQTSHPKGRVWERTVSYASRVRGERALTDTFPGSTSLACDDTEGQPHHANGINVVFFDTHADFYEDLNPWPGQLGSVGREKPVDVLRN